MLNSLGNSNSIPNNYVYTSHRGTEYMYLDGSWLNCETMKVVEGNHNFKMNQSAIKQIAEHNEKHSLKIGKKYAINESTYTYVGRNNFTLNGNLLNENMNSNVQRLVEAASFTNFVPGDPNSTDIPNRFVLYGDTVYYKDKKQWYSNGKFIDSKQDTADLNKAAIKEIEKINKQDDYPIGSTVDWNGQTMSWTGSNWTYPDGKRAGDKFTREVDDFVQDNPEVLKNTSKGNLDQSDNSQSSNTEVPNGYVYTSGKGKSYFKKNGQWFSSETKKPINSSSSIPLERAALASIEKHNESAPVKIGAEWKSKKGITYRYLGNNRFISDSGKLLPPDSARTVMAKLWQEAGGNDTNDEPEQNSEEPQDQNQGNSSPQPERQEPPAQGTGSDSNDPLSGLAKEIKSNPMARKIIVLLSRGDAVSLLAADILLSGKQNEVTQILKSLNNED